MRNTAEPSAIPFTDAELVAQTLAGSREAFGEIVTRYQALVCSVAYSATGSLSESEDLSQETFLTAWRRLRELREPGSIRSWLCAIARNLSHRARRDQLREPAHAAESLDHAHEMPSPEVTSPVQAISREEEGIMWRSLERIPENYREPLILFYRQHESIERVAELLDISEDTARQRLSRGRKLLQEEVAAFVEGALRHSTPNGAFCASVMSALPLQSGFATGISGAAKGGFLSWISLPIVGLFASLLGSVGLVRLAGTPRVRRLTIRMLLAMWLDCVGLWIALPLTQWLRVHRLWSDPAFALVQAVCYLVWSAVMATLVVLSLRGFLALHRGITPAGTPQRAAAPAKSAGIVAGIMTVGSLAWLAQLTWMAHDAASLAVTVATAAAVIGWILFSPVWLQRNGRDAAGFAWLPAALIGSVSLILLNTRLDRWIAALRGTDLAEAHHFLPMGIVYAATLLLLLWISAVIFLTRPRDHLPLSSL